MNYELYYKCNYIITNFNSYQSLIIILFIINNINTKDYINNYHNINNHYK